MTEVSLDQVSLELDTMGLNLKQLYYFHAVATEGSIARAARRLKVTQPTISEQLRNLEQFLQTILFDRRPGGLRLNQEGRRVFEHTQVMFRAVRRLLQDLNPQRSNERWVLEIGVCSTVSRAYAAERFLPLFKMKNIAPRIRSGGYETLLDRLLRGELDLLLSENMPSEADKKRVGVRALSESPLVAIAAPELAERVKDYPADLGLLPFMSYPQSSRYRWELDAFFQDNGIAPDLVAEADDVVLLAVAATRGMCWVAVPETVVKQNLSSGKLKRLGPIAATRSTLFAQFQQVNTPQLVLDTIEALSRETSL
jgi:LysR family transcriptional activator of nhaA